MTEDMFIIGAFFFTLIVLLLGIPIVRALVRRADRLSAPPANDPARDERLARMERAIDAVAIEVERISEGQRFVTKLLSERASPQAALPAPRDETVR